MYDVVVLYTPVPFASKHIVLLPFTGSVYTPNNLPGILLLPFETHESCIVDIKAGMTSNFLKLNDQYMSSAKTGVVAIEVSCTENNIDVTFNKTMNMDVHINATCKRAFWQSHNIRSFWMRRLQLLVHSFVIPQINYCNSFLYRLSKKQPGKLECVLNCTARVVAKVKMNIHVTPTLVSLHWLPISQRIEFKVVLVTFKALRGVLTPGYRSELLH